MKIFLDLLRYNENIFGFDLMTIILLHFIQRKEEEIEEALVKHSKMRRLHQLQGMIIENTNQISSVSDVTSMDTLR
jgi:hypothetical protein